VCASELAYEARVCSSLFSCSSFPIHLSSHPSLLLLIARHIRLMHITKLYEWHLRPFISLFCYILFKRYFILQDSRFLVLNLYIIASLTPDIMDSVSPFLCNHLHILLHTLARTPHTISLLIE